MDNEGKKNTTREKLSQSDESRPVATSGQEQSQTPCDEIVSDSSMEPFLKEIFLKLNDAENRLMMSYFIYF